MGNGAKGDILFHEREYPPLNPPRERFRLAVWSSNNLYASGMKMPARGKAALALRYDLPLLLSSAVAQPLAALPPYGCGTPLAGAALPVSWQCSLISVYRGTHQCGECNNAAFGTQSAAVLSSHAPHDSKARLQTKTNRRGSWRSHVHRTYIAQRVQLFKPSADNGGVKGQGPLRSLGGSKGGHSLT